MWSLWWALGDGGWEMNLERGREGWRALVEEAAGERGAVLHELHELARAGVADAGVADGLAEVALELLQECRLEILHHLGPHSPSPPHFHMV